MKAILVKQPGGREQLELGEWQKPIPAKDELLVKVKAAAVNRADILQREGKYPPPKGASPILGLEICGVIEEVGDEAGEWKKGDEVFGLLPGGAYAEYAVIHKNMALAKPEHLSFEEAAAIPEVFLTAYQSLIWIGKLQFNEKVLIHAGASGVGTAAIQIARQFNTEIIVTASAGKHRVCHELGATFTIDYQTESFPEKVKQITNGSGVDLIIDFIGGTYFKDNINSLALDGRLVLLAALGGGNVGDFNMAKILMKRLQITGSTLRSRTVEYQIKLTRHFWSFAERLFENGKLKPVIYKVYDWNDVVMAHQCMEENRNSGKIVLRID